MATLINLLDTRYGKLFGNPRKVAEYIKDSCQCDCYACAYPHDIPCFRNFDCDTTIDDLIDWLMEVID